MIFTSPCADIEIPAVALTDFVLEHSAEHGDKPALIDGATGAAYTHAQAAGAIRAAAGGLAERGVARGDVDELAFQLEHAGARALISGTEVIDRARDAAGRAGIEELYVFGEADGATPF